MPRLTFVSLVLGSLAAFACSSEPSPSSVDDDASTSPSSSSSTGGAGGEGGAGGGEGGAGGVTTPPLEVLLADLRSDVEATMLAQSRGSGWPAPVDGGYLVVSTDASLTEVAGDHDDWAGTPMTADRGFSWLVLPMAPGDRYKFTDGTDYVADPWGRAYAHDAFGVMTMLAPTSAHLERFFAVGNRTVRVWVPEGTPTHVLYVHDGQNLFDPAAGWGGWTLEDEILLAMMVVGIDNTPARFDEYTHVPDDFGSGVVGGDGDAYAAFVNETVRALVATHYGEPPTLGVMGSSLGGLISLHIVDRFPSEFHFAASLSGTLGWGSIGLDNETMIERLQTAGLRDVALYVDSGGSGTCYDDDGDGIEDDGPDSDNYCENRQLANVLEGVGYTTGVDLWYWHEPDAPHNEAAWGARVFRPLSIFSNL